MKNSIFMLIVLGFIAFACNKEPFGQQPIDNVPPGPVSNVKIEPTSGGAIFTYTLPQNEDLLYVKAVYSLKEGVMSEVRSSLYSNTLKIEGFGDTQERQVKLIAVDQSRNESSEVILTIVPIEPPVITIGNTLNMVADFGGVRGFWDNPNHVGVSAILLKEDHNKEYVPFQNFYSTSAMDKGEVIQRGLDTIPANFGIYLQDRWENRSEIKYFTLTPFYETMFDRLKFNQVLLPNDDQTIYGGVCIMPNMWSGAVDDGITYQTAQTGLWPISFTVDLGVTGKLSRIKFWQQQFFMYMKYQLRKFEVWGCQTIDKTGNWASWTKMMDCEVIKPSGSEYGILSAEDLAQGAAGHEFVFPLLNPKVRYIRIKVTENWSTTTRMEVDELQVFGDNR